MPSVERETLLGIIKSVGSVGNHAGVRCAKGFIAVFVIEVVRAAEVVLCACAADSREFSVAVHEELYLALTPPAVVVDAPSHVCAYIMTLAFNTVENCVNFLIWYGVASSELSVEVAAVFQNFRELIVYLIVKREYVIREVFNRYAAALLKRHCPVAVETVSRVYAYCKGAHLLERGNVCVCEEVAEGAFDCGNIASVPVHTDDNVSSRCACRCEPDVVYHARAVDFSHCVCRVRLDSYRGR